MSRKLTYEEVKERFINKGYELISQEYINANTKLEYICPKHRDKGIQEISIGSLSKHGCYWCGLESRSNKRKLNYEEIKKEFEKRGFTLLSKNYINSKTKLKFLCPKHGIQYNDWTHFRISKINGCPECAEIARRNKKRTSFSFIQKEFKKRGYILISNNYKNRNTKLEYICPRHKDVGIQEISWSKFYNGKQGCPYCYGNVKKTTKEFKKEVFDLVGEEYTVIGKYTNALTHVTMKHNICGHIWKVNPSSFLSNGRRCPQCIESKGEQIIREYLTNKDIGFIQEHSFDGLIGINGGLLRFDFYLQSYNLLIEYDGEQHFEPMRFKSSTEDFKKQQIHDKRKNTYCLKNKIPLLRIPYWEFDNIEKILNEALVNKDSAFLIA